MKTNSLLELDCRDEDNMEVIQEVLRTLKPLSKYSDEELIPLDALEKVIRIMTRKYLVRIRSIMPDIWANRKYDIWRCEVVNDHNLDLIGYVYGVSLYEVMAKAVILIYSKVKKERLELR